MGSFVDDMEGVLLNRKGCTMVRLTVPAVLVCTELLDVSC